MHYTSNGISCCFFVGALNWRRSVFFFKGCICGDVCHFCRVAQYFFLFSIFTEGEGVCAVCVLCASVCCSRERSSCRSLDSHIPVQNLPHRRHTTREKDIDIRHIIHQSHIYSIYAIPYANRPTSLNTQYLLINKSSLVC